MQRIVIPQPRIPQCGTEIEGAAPLRARGIGEMAQPDLAGHVSVLLPAPRQRPARLDVYFTEYFIEVVAALPLFKSFIDIFTVVFDKIAMKSMRAKSGRRGTTRDKQREATIARLLEAARRLFAEHGMENVTVTEIGRAAGVSPSLINAYFDGKAGLLYALVRENNAPQMEAALKIAEGPGNAEERLFALLGACMEGDLGDPVLLALMQAYSWTWSAETEAENREERAAFKAILAGLLREGAAGGQFRADLPDGETATAIFAIYTWSLRMAVFEGLDAAACTGRLRSLLTPLLRPQTP